MNKLSIIFFAFFLLVSFGLSAESVSDDNKSRNKSFISGKISYENSIGDIGVELVNVCLISGKDSLWTTTNTHGLFTFKDIKPGKINLKAFLVGYKPIAAEYEVVAGENVIFLTMERDMEYLNAAKVTAEGELVKMKGDTTVYNTRLLTTMEGDNAAELFLQLPGASMSNGKVTINGKQIKRTYINGILIYGDNPNSALNALLAEEVTSMKVYEEDSVEDKKKGLKHGRKETVLDIETKDAIISAVDLHALASGGVDQTRKSDGSLQYRYGAGVTGNFYSEMFLASINAYADNINRGSNQLNSITSASGGLNNYNEKLHLDTGMEKFWGNRLMGNSVRFSYSFDKDYTADNSTSITDYFATDESPEMRYFDRNISSSVTKSHYAYLGASLNNDIIKSLNIGCRFDYDDRHTADTWISENLIDGNTLKQNQVMRTGDKTWKSYNHLSWLGQGLSSRFTPSIDADVNIGRDGGQSWTTDTLASSFNKRELISEMAGRNQLYSVMPQIRVMLKNDDTKSSELYIRYRYTFDEHTNLKTTMDYWNVEVPVIDYSNTFDYTYKTHTHNATVFWNMTTARQLSMGLEVSANVDILTDSKTIPEAYTNSTSYISILPNFNIKFKKYEFRYSTSKILPSLEQIRYQMDDRNPFMLRIGNPDLKRSMVHKLEFRYDTYTQKRHAICVRLNADFVSNSIVVKSRYFDSQETINIGYDYVVNPGSTLYSYSNANGAFNASGMASWSTRFNKLKTSINVYLGTDYKKAPMYIGEQSVMLSEVCPYVYIVPTITPAKWFRLNFNSRSRLVHSTNNLKERIAFAFHQNLKVNLGLKGPKVTFANLSYIWDGYRFFKGTGKDTHIHLLNAVIGCRLLKDQMTISLSGHDLLNSGSIYNMRTGSNYISQTWTPSYGRYFMLNISFRLNRLGKNVSSMGRKSDGTPAHRYPIVFGN